MKIVPLDKLLPIKTNLKSPNCYPIRSEKVQGILLHFDDSSNDVSSLQWFRDPKCRVSYNRLYFDDGKVAQITSSMEQCAWHAGKCRPSNDNFTYKGANSAFYGLAIAADDNDVVTPKQLASLAADCVAVFQFHGWTKKDLWRITGHDAEAWTRGRKVDPTGTNPHEPVLRVQAVRDLVEQKL